MILRYLSIFSALLLALNARCTQDQQISPPPLHVDTPQCTPFPGPQHQVQAQSKTMKCVG
jgi:hypothetical protein